MSKTISPATHTSARSPLPSPPRTRPTGFWFYARKGVQFLASLKLTVVLFALAIALVFFGTMAQREEGTWTVLRNYFRTGIAWIPVQIFARFGQVFLNLFPNNVSWPGRFPFPGGWLIGGLLLLNLLAAHISRFRLTWKRSGILVLHAGFAILMLSELITGLFAVEWQMPIKEGGSANFITESLSARLFGEIRRSELAVIAPGSSGKDDVVVVPGAMLRKGDRISSADLPFDLELVRFMNNSTIAQKPEGEEENPATAGDGLEEVVLEKPEAAGTDTERGEDMPSAYVTFFKKGTDQPLGTYLVTTWWSDDTPLFPGLPQMVKVDGKKFKVFLRFKRTYLPYTIHLLEFRHDKYLGTEEARNFSSRIRLIDPESGLEREVVISMNNPLRYAGKTFYQAFVLGKDQGTVLQVVENPGWLVPYISCALIALGLIFHFSLHLVGFLRRRVA